MKIVRMLICIMLGFFLSSVYDIIAWPRSNNDILLSRFNRILEKTNSTREQIISELNNQLVIDGYSEWTVEWDEANEHIVRLRKKGLSHVDIVFEGMVNNYTGKD